MSGIPRVEQSLDEFVFGYFSFCPIGKGVLKDDFVPRPRAYVAQQQLESFQIDPCLQPPCRVLRTPRCDERHRLGRRIAIHDRWRGDGGEKLVIDGRDLIFGESTGKLEVPYGCPFGKHFNLVGNDRSESPSFRLNGLFGDDVELAKSDDQEFLKIGDRSYPRI